MVGFAFLGAGLPPLLTTAAVLIIAITIGLFGVLAWAAWGRDPFVVDDDSILAAGPPAGLRPCLAVVLHDGHGGDRSLSVALLDLAVRGLLEIHDDPLVGNGDYMPRAWIDVPRRARTQLGQPEQVLAAALGLERPGAARLDSIAVIIAVGSARPAFDSAVDDDLVAAGWYRRPPSQTSGLWFDAAEVVVAAGIVGAVLAILAESLPLLIAYGGLIAAGAAGRRFASVMPARTRSGAMVAAMLKAYRRTLRKTLALADSVWDVIGVRELAWFETPDRMILWAMALDLEEDLSAMFARANRAPVGEPWFPDWFGTTVPDPYRMFRSLDHLTSSASP